MNAYRTQLQFRAKIAELERQQREVCAQYGLHIDLNEPERIEQPKHKPKRKSKLLRILRRLLK